MFLAEAGWNGHCSWPDVKFQGQQQFCCLSPFFLLTFHWNYLRKNPTGHWALLEISIPSSLLNLGLAAFFGISRYPPCSVWLRCPLQHIPSVTSVCQLYRARPSCISGLKAGVKHLLTLQVFNLGSHCYAQPRTQKAGREKPLLFSTFELYLQHREQPTFVRLFWHSHISLLFFFLILQMNEQEDLHLHIKEKSCRASLGLGWTYTNVFQQTQPVALQPLVINI